MKTCLLAEHRRFTILRVRPDLDGLLSAAGPYADTVRKVDITIYLNFKVWQPLETISNSLQKYRQES